MPADYLPGYAEQANLHRNYWAGFWLVIVIGFVLFALLMWILGLIMKKNILGVIFSDEGTGSDRAVAMAIGGTALVAVIGTVMYYIYRSGGTLASASTDAHVIGLDRGTMLTNRDAPAMPMI